MKPMTPAQRFESVMARGLLSLPSALLRIMAGKPVVKRDQTLDVQCQMMLRLQRLRGEDKIGGRALEAERRNINEQSRVLEPRADGHIAAEDIRVAGAEGDLPARRYRPAGCSDAAPAVVFYHGGGFVIGSLDSHDGVCRVLAECAQCVVISVDYRLAPEQAAPHGLNDAVAAFRDIAAHAGEHGIDAQRIAVSGDSAGGNLSAVVAQQTRDDTISPCFQLLFYPATDFARDRDSVFEFAEGFLLEKASMDWFRERYLQGDIDNADPRVSPIHGDLTNLSPALVVTAGFDPLQDEGKDYAAALEAAGNKVETRHYEGLIHGFLNMAGAVRGAEQALAESAGLLKRAFDGGRGAKKAA